MNGCACATCRKCSLRWSAKERESGRRSASWTSSTRSMETTLFKQKCAAALEVMRQSSQIVAVGHRNPDADSIGSVLPFAPAVFDNERRSVLVYSSDGVPAAFAALEGSERVQTKLEWHPDLIVGFDYGDF